MNRTTGSHDEMSTVVEPDYLTRADAARKWSLDTWAVDVLVTAQARINWVRAQTAADDVYGTSSYAHMLHLANHAWDILMDHGDREAISRRDMDRAKQAAAAARREWVQLRRTEARDA